MNDTAYTLRQIAEFLGATLKGNNEQSISSIVPIQSAHSGALCFVLPGKTVDLDKIDAGVLLLHEKDSHKYSGNKIIVDDPYLAFAKVSALFDVKGSKPLGIDSTAKVNTRAQIDPTASIGPNVVIEADVKVGPNTQIDAGCVIGQGVNIGPECHIYPNVTIYHFVSIGQRVNIHSGAVIGSDGFGFAPNKGAWQKIHQIGSVSIGDNVDIGANTTIDRGALTDTIICSNVIIDNLVHIAHNVEIGEGTAIAGCSAIAGSTKVGKHCMIAGRVSITGHLNIADKTQFNACTVVTSSIKESGVYASASPLQKVHAWRRNAVRLTQLDSWVKKIKSLEKSLKN